MNKAHNHFHHFFSPKESNNYRAKTLHLDFLTMYLVIALMFSIFVNHFKSGSVLGFATDISNERLFELTNAERVKNNLPALKYNDKLSVAAQGKAQNMLTNSYWAHFAPDGTTPWSFILNSGYQYSVAGENLAKGFYFNNNVVEAWMASPTHRENILRDAYQDVGFAVVNGNLNGEETTLVVQMFGTQVVPVVAKAPVPEPIAQVSAAPANVQPTAAVQVAPVVTIAAEKQYFQPQAAVLAKTSPQTSPKFNLFPFVLNINVIFLLLLAAVLIFDFYMTKKMGIARLSGKNLAHFAFIGFVFVGIYIISRGGIIQ